MTWTLIVNQINVHAIRTQNIRLISLVHPQL